MWKSDGLDDWKSISAKMEQSRCFVSSLDISS